MGSRTTVMALALIGVVSVPVAPASTTGGSGGSAASSSSTSVSGSGNSGGSGGHASSGGGGFAGHGSGSFGGNAFGGVHGQQVFPGMGLAAHGTAVHTLSTLHAEVRTTAARIATPEARPHFDPHRNYSVDKDANPQSGVMPREPLNPCEFLTNDLFFSSCVQSSKTRESLKDK